MKRFFWLILSTLVIFGVTPFLSQPISAQGTSQTTNGSGINIDPTSSGGYPSPDDVKTLGAQWVRIGYAPNAFPDKAAYEQRFSEAVKQYSQAGIDVIVVLNQDSTPNLSYSNNVADLSQNNFVENFSNTGQYLAQTYGKEISAYEVWNEENAGSAASIYVSPDQYASLLASAYNSIKTADPNSKVIIGGLIGGEQGYLKDVLNSLPDQTNLPFDGIGVHPYDPTPNTAAAMLLSYFDLAKSTGKQIWVTEVGWQGDQNPESQSAYIRDIFSYAQDHPDLIANMMWYAWSDAMNPGFGLIGIDGKAKLSFQAFQQFAAKLKTLISPGYKFKPATVPVLKPRISSKSASKPLQYFPDEQEIACDNTIYGSPNGETPNLYRTSKGQTQNEMRTDAGLNYSGMVKGTHCGQVKSQPIVLEEVARFNPNDGPKCVNDVGWTGEVRYGTPATNFRIPFAEQIADHWAGTWDAEHMSEADIDQKTKDAAQPPSTNIIQTALSLVGIKTGPAPYDLLNKSGVLKKLVSQDQQDQLKCSFIKYVRDQGNKSLYKDFAIGGTKLTDIPCPPTIANPNATLTDYTNWQKTWGDKWSKMGLIPNEKSVQNFRFMVCGDRQYLQSQAVPEVFRMGLAANELFKIFTAKDNEIKYYSANNDNLNLKLPLDKNVVLAYAQSDTGGEGVPSDLASNTDTSLKNTLPVKKEASVFQKIADFIKNLLSGEPPILAQESTSPTAVGTIFEKDGKIQFYVTVTNPSFVEDDMAAEVTINGQKMASSGYHNIRNPAPGIGSTTTFGSKGSGATFEVWDPLPITPSQTYNISYHISTNYQCLNNKLCGPNSNFTGTVENAAPCSVQVAANGSLNTSCGGQPPAGPGEQPKGPMCNQTPTCTASCRLCGKSQLGPSDTTMLNTAAGTDANGTNHVMFGVDWTGFLNGTMSEAGQDIVKLVWWIPGWDGTFKNLPPGCKVVQCNPSDITCLNDSSTFRDVSTGDVGRISCAKVNERVIDVYNDVPFLASAWNEAAGATVSQIGGFLNVFKPKCDPTDPNSICSHPATPSNNFTGCSTDQKYVFDSIGNFSTYPGATYLTYGFTPYFKSSYIKRFTYGVTVTQKSPAPGEKAKVLFYRIGGLCNADSWVGSKAMFPQTVY